MLINKREMYSLLIFLLVMITGCSQATNKVVTPNQFQGSDIERILAAIDAAKGTTNKVVIPAQNSNGTNIWLIDEAILLPSYMTLILDNCTIQLSDQSRDNIIRSDNVGEGISNPDNWNYNISIIGIGNPVLRGAANPRSTGDSGKTLVTDSYFGRGKFSYGSDTGKEEVKQKGDWRNFGIVIGLVDGFKITNITIEQTHGWAITHERVINADLSFIRINNRPYITVDGETRYVNNRDGINLRHGCKNFRIDNITGVTGDDFIALTILGLNSLNKEWGSLNSSLVTSREWRGPEDDIENVYITNVNCETKNRGVAIRAIEEASIHHIYINGLIAREMKDFEKYHSAMLVGGTGYGETTLGKINNIYATNLYGRGGVSLIHIEQPISDCTFMNGMYNGDGEYVVSYNYIGTDHPKNKISKGNIGNKEVRNVREINMIKVP